MGRFFVTILLPSIAPIVALPFLKLFNLPPAAAALAKPMVPVKDGQLCWISLGFCASAVYERRTGHVPVSGSDRYLAGFILIMIASAGIAAGGAIQPVAYPKPAGHAWWSHFKLFAASLVAVLISSVSFMAIHFQEATGS